MIALPPKQGLKPWVVSTALTHFAGYDSTSTKTRIETMHFRTFRTQSFQGYDSTSTKTRIETFNTSEFHFVNTMVMIALPPKQGLKL